MALILLRHGQTEANRDRLLLGRGDPDLTPLGRTQAEAAAAAVGPPRRLVTSPLGRARQTASAFAPVEAEVDERWIEIDYGDIDGQPLADISPEVWSTWRSDPSYAPAGGESLEAVHRRVVAACEALVDDATTGDVVVVSHVTPIKSAVAWALGTPVSLTWRLHLDVAGLTRIELRSGGTPLLRTYNTTSHLRQEAEH